MTSPGTTATPYEQREWQPARRRCLARYRHRCGFLACRVRGDANLDVHHLTKWREGGAWFAQANLVALCDEHHDQVEKDSSLLPLVFRAVVTPADVDRDARLEQRCAYRLHAGAVRRQRRRAAAHRAAYRPYSPAPLTTRFDTSVFNQRLSRESIFDRRLARPPAVPDFVRSVDPMTSFQLPDQSFAANLTRFLRAMDSASAGRFPAL